MSIGITKKNIYTSIYALVLFMPIFYPVLEINFIVSSFFLSLVLIEKHFKYSLKLVSLTSLLSFIFIVGLISHFFYAPKIYDVIKDSVYLFKPIVYLFLGYFLASKIKDMNTVFKIIIYLGIVFAIIHLSKVLVFILNNEVYQISKIRYYGGKDNYMELVACSLLVLNVKNRFFGIKIKFKKLFYFILTISFIFYFSRTMVVAFVILWVAGNGYAKLTKNGIVILTSVSLGVILFYIGLNSLNIDRGATGFEGFLYKLKIAPEEIFNAEINFDDPVDRWDHWRAYEASKAIEQLQQTPYNMGIFFGKGLGSLIDLGFEAELGNEKMQYIPKIHNGYIYVLFKSGIIGLLMYITFLFFLYLQIYNKFKSVKQIFINNLISALGFFYVFSSFIISGIYNPTDVITVILGAFLFFQQQYKKAIK